MMGFHEAKAQYSGMANACDALFIVLRRKAWPHDRREHHLRDSMGQLCFDDAAAHHAAYYLYNNRLGDDWDYVSWRVTMSGPLVGPRAKMSGIAPDNFSIQLCSDGRFTTNCRPPHETDYIGMKPIGRPVLRTGSGEHHVYRSRYRNHAT